MSSAGKSTNFTSYVDIFSESSEKSGGDGAIESPGSPDPLDKLVEICGERDCAGALSTDSWLYIPRDVFLPPPQAASSGTTQESEAELSSPLCTVPQSPQIATGNALCGFLNKYKQGARGLNRIFKRRWFVFSDASCKLLYYRTPQDIIPLGEINISTATFSFDVQNIQKQSVFEIRSQNCVYYLEAQDKHTMLYWLQELQKRRRNHSQWKTQASKEQMSVAKDGLAGSQVKPDSDDFMPNIFGGVDMPADTIGTQAAVGASHIKDFSIANWRTELKNHFALRKASKDESHSRPLSPPTSAEKVTPSSLSTSTGNIASATSREPTPPRNTQVSEKLANIKNRLIRSKSSVDSDSPHGSVLSKSLCHRCKKFQDQVNSQKEEAAILEEELHATREVVKILHKQLDKYQRQAQTQKEFKESENLLDLSDKETPTEGAVSHLDMMLQRDQQIVDLEHLLFQTQQHSNILKAQLQCVEKEVQGLKEDVEMYQESISSKDKVVMSLTDRLAEMEMMGRQGASSTPIADSATNTTATLLADAREVDKLRDVVEAYRLQNQLLNQELLELSQLRADDEARELSARMRYTEMEAKFYQIKSKWLLSLKELSKPRRDYGDPSEDTVCQLLEDAMMTTESSSASSPSDRGSPIRQSHPIRNKGEINYDQYGFPYLDKSTHIHDEDLEEHAESLLRKSDELCTQAMDLEKEISVHVKWENYLVSLGNRPLQQSPELKSLIRAGIPMEYRGKVWKACIDWKTAGLRKVCGNEYYQTLLEHADAMVATGINPLSRQIEVDLLRTLPDNKHYECLTSDGIPKLRRVLLAYSVHNPEVGYCQGLNRVAAIALLFLSEEDAFWSLVAIVESIMPREYFTQSLVAAHADQRVLKELVADKLPRLTAHLEQHNVDLSLFTFNWFMTIFVDNVPVDTFLRIWDCFLYEGSKILFRYAIAFLKYREGELCARTSDIGLHEYLRSIGETMTNANKIAQIAFHELNPFPQRTIHSKHQTHLQRIKEELKKFDELRQQFENSTSSIHCEAIRIPEEDLGASDDEQI